MLLLVLLTPLPVLLTLPPTPLLPPPTLPALLLPTPLLVLLTPPLVPLTPLPALPPTLLLPSKALLLRLLTLLRPPKRSKPTVTPVTFGKGQPSGWPFSFARRSAACNVAGF